MQPKSNRFSTRIRTWNELLVTINSHKDDKSQQKWLKSIKNNLSTFFGMSSGFKNEHCKKPYLIDFLEELDKERHYIILQLFGHKLTHFIRDGDLFIHVMRTLEAKTREDVFDMFKHAGLLPKLCRTTDQLSHLFLILNEKKTNALLRHLKKSIIDIPKDLDEYITLLSSKSLTLPQKKYLLLNTQDAIPSFIHNEDHLIKLYSHACEEIQALMIKLLGPIFTDLYTEDNSYKAINKTLNSVKPQHQKVILPHIVSSQPYFIYYHSNTFSTLKKYYDGEISQELRQTKRIKNWQQLYFTLERYSLKRKDNLFSRIRKIIPEYISCFDELFLISQKLNLQQNRDLFEEIQHKLPKLMPENIWDQPNLRLYLTKLSKKQKFKIYSSPPPYSHNNSLNSAPLKLKKGC